MQPRRPTLASLPLELQQRILAAAASLPSFSPAPGAPRVLDDLPVCRLRALCSVALVGRAWRAAAEHVRRDPGVQKVVTINWHTRSHREALARHADLFARTGMVRVLALSEDACAHLAGALAGMLPRAGCLNISAAASADALRRLARAATEVHVRRALFLHLLPRGGADARLVLQLPGTAPPILRISVDDRRRRASGAIVALHRSAACEVLHVIVGGRNDATLLTHGGRFGELVLRHSGPGVIGVRDSELRRSDNVWLHRVACTSGDAFPLAARAMIVGEVPLVHFFPSPPRRLKHLYLQDGEAACRLLKAGWTHQALATPGARVVFDAPDFYHALLALVE